jgi:signal transduction histidine kinase
VLTNLVGNAIKFTEQGAIVIRVSSIDETPSKVTMRFEVKDTGIGISREAQSADLRRILAGRRIDHAQARRIGLGLAISKELVEMMGGEIHVDPTLARAPLLVHRHFERQAGRAKVRGDDRPCSRGCAR